MKIVKSILLLSLAILNFSTNTVAQKTVSMPKKDFILSTLKENRVPTVGICILSNGKIKQAKVFGRLPDNSPAPDNTIFNIASLTKPLISMMTVMLVSRNEWNLDEPLFHFWTDPDVAADPRHKLLTTRHVLSHRTGLPNWRGNEPGGKLSFAFEPGTQWKYSGEGFEYLRQSLEQKFKMPIEALAEKLLFKPFKMRDTRFYWDETMDEKRYANRFHADGTPFELETWKTANAANLVLVTVRDYGKLGIEVMKGSGLSEKVFKEMISTQTVLENKKEFGLGWSLVKNLSNGEYALVHTGRNPGINTIVILLPESKRGIVVFTNGEKGDLVYQKIIGESFDLGKEIIERVK